MRNFETEPWKKSELWGCELLEMKHLGGPGKPDCIDEKNPKRIGEVKDYRRSFNSYDLKRELQKPRMKEVNEINILVMGPCTSNAKETAKKNSSLKLCCDLRNFQKFSNWILFEY